MRTKYKYLRALVGYTARAAQESWYNPPGDNESDDIPRGGIA